MFRFTKLKIKNYLTQPRNLFNIDFQLTDNNNTLICL